MSHGSTDKCEPNMTPLLDLVLQLVMFFMLCANFVMEQTSVEIKLPTAAAARALDKGDVDVLFLNVNEQGKILLTPDQREGDTETLDNVEQVRGYMKRATEREKKAWEARKQKWDKPVATIILRVDYRTPFKDTYGIMKACREAGYEKVQLRAEVSNEG